MTDRSTTARRSLSLVTRRRLLTAIAVAIPLALGLYLVRHVVFGGGLPPGDDMPYHAAKNDFATRWFFADGHLDGWSPLFSLGSQQFLLYGPGMAVVSALLRLLTLNHVSQQTALGLVASLGFMATAPAMAYLARVCGLSRAASAIAAVVALTVSVPYGVGIAGTFDLGLAPHQVATPLVLLFFAFGIQLTERPCRRFAVLTGAAAAAVAVTHLTSLLVALVAFALLYLPVIGRFRPTVDRARGVALAGVAFVGLAAWWAIPLAAHSGPRPPTATWETPPFWTRVGEIVGGYSGTNRGLGYTMVAAILIGLIDATVATVRGRSRPPWTWGFLTAGVTTLAALHFLHYRLSGDVSALIANRGLGYVLLLLVLPIAYVADRAMKVTTWPPNKPELARVMGIAVVALVAVAVGSTASLIPADDVMVPPTARQPSPVLVEVAKVLDSSMPAWSRYVWVHEGDFDHKFGMIHPELWLAMQTRHNTMNGFGGETISPADTFAQYRLKDMDVTEATKLLRRDGVSHLVVSPAQAVRYAGNNWERIYDDPQISVLKDRSASQQAVAVDGDAAPRLTAYRPDRYAWTVSGDGTIQVAIPAFDKWHFTVTRRTGSAVKPAVSAVDGFWTVPVHDGDRLVAQFRRDASDSLGLALTFVTLFALVGFDALVRRRRMNARHDVERSALGLLDHPAEVLADDAEEAHLQSPQQ